MRWPFGKTQDVKCISISSGNGCPARAPSVPAPRRDARRSSPAPATCVTVPSGATSEARDTSRRAAHRPRPGAARAAGPGSRRPPSSGARVVDEAEGIGRPLVRRHVAPPHAPDRRPRCRSSARSAADARPRRRRRSAASVWSPADRATRSRIRAIGHPSSERHSPGASSRYGPGGCQSRTYTAKRGSSMIPVSRPFSHWSNQRTASCRHSICGFGYGSCGIGVVPRRRRSP